MMDPKHKAVLEELRAAGRLPGVKALLALLEPDRHATSYFGHREAGGVEVWLTWLESKVKGRGFKALQAIAEVADHHDVVLRLESDDHGSGKLSAMYERAGFYVDPAGGAIMERVPLLSQERAIRQWMPDSVVTLDGSRGGAPRPVYHASDAHFTLSQMRPSSEGSFGAGFYFAGSVDHALLFAAGDDEPNLMEVYLDLQRPYHYRIREGLDVDLWGEGIVRDTMDADAAARLIRSVLESGAGFDDRLQNHLIELGHDGVIATYADGTQELVAFDRASIREVHHLHRQGLPDDWLVENCVEACHG